ncbi:MAG: tyrosine-type recombinase/integrase, partial [Candidatus Bathyarchaeota archaeon]|nr:tyrosine-type recombinase/integrase [Candidatus Bathyarchaeota archaeon]
MVKMNKQWEQFIKQHLEVEEWLKNRPTHTKRQFAARLQRFCEAIGMTPEEWRNLDKFEARDLAWNFIKNQVAEKPSTANVMLITLKSFYRNKNGEVLPFDSNRGGKHYFHIRRKKRALEHIPSKPEMYQIIDMASSLRDKAFLLFLFQTGVRVNVLEHLPYGHVADQLDQDIITLKITGQLDFKLRSRDISFYYTFLNGEGVETLRRYCKLTHKHGKPNDPLFTTRGYRPVSQSYILKVVKMCVKRAGFDPATMWTHTIRKAFRKIVRQTDIDDDDKEQLMGHVIQ